MTRKKLDNSFNEVELWEEDYYEQSPEELFSAGGALNFSPRNYELARRVVSLCSPPAEVYATREALGVMSEGSGEPAVWVVNHLALTDPPTAGRIAHDLHLQTPRYLAMAELFDREHPHVAEFIASIGGIPFDRAKVLAGSKRVVAHVLEVSDYVLQELEQPLVIFPEGRITAKSSKYPNRVAEVGGIATRIAKRSKVPMVVWGLGGTREMLPHGLNPFTRKRVGISITDVFRTESGYPSPLQLQMRMQVAANIARTLSKNRN